MSRTLLHDWECSIEKNKNNTEELLKIAEDIYNTAYARGKANTEQPQGEWIYDNKLNNWKCSVCLETPKTIGYVGNRDFMNEHFKYCNHCGAIMANSAK